MSRLAYATSFRDLVVYQQARSLAKDLYQTSKGFPREEQFSLTDQLRRAVRSVGAQIAEAWGKRKYPKHFASKLTDADAEQLESQHWVECARDAGYLSDEQARDFILRLSSVGKMLNSMISKTEQFCKDDGRLVQEETENYKTVPDVAMLNIPDLN